MSTWDRLVYRLRQFGAELNARPLPDAALGEVRELLSPAEYALFQRFSLSDQNHSYAVMTTLRGAGHDDRELLQAALLHDIGKTRLPIHIWDRVVIVMGQALAPAQVGRWGEGEPAGWRRPFVIKEKHPAWGAEMAAAAGSSARLIALINHHQDRPETVTPAELAATLRQLQWADDQH
ncbi:MAG: HD domain-containing protein [Anaerolineales bacterium]|nr:HD domain-containing protein [Anaerolineales bacterium]MCB0010415.1 HD domain-containing protein [Anaerolineales bacterium]